MESKTLGTILIVLACIFFFPVMIGIIGGVFGIIMGVFGAVFGVIGGILGGIFGAFFGVFGWIFDTLFCWDTDFHFFDFNIFVVAALVIAVVLISRKRQVR